MADQLFRQTYAPGAEIFREGEVGTHAYVIERGQVEVTSLHHGHAVRIATLGPGELFGEMALIDDQVRSATVTAVEETECVRVDRSQFAEKMGRADPLLNLLLLVILRRFRWTQQRMIRQGATVGDAMPAADAAVPDDASYIQTRDQALTRVRLEQELKRAVEEEQFELHFQPVIALRGGHTAGFEALVRWNHPDHGQVSPVQFIGMAEDTGMIVPIGRWVLERALEAHARFQQTHSRAFPGLPPLFISVNVSGRQLLELDEIEAMAGIVRRSGHDPRTVKLEITESLMVDDPDHARIALHKLKEAGVTVAIDDFGTGYSSLSYLHRFPLDTLKIDRSFVANMLHDNGSLQIVRAICGLARDLGMDIVAEGIESAHEITQLRDFGCSYGQGFLMSRPVTLDQAEAMLSRRISW